MVACSAKLMQHRAQAEGKGVGHLQGMASKEHCNFSIYKKLKSCRTTLQPLSPSLSIGKAKCYLSWKMKKIYDLFLGSICVGREEMQMSKFEPDVQKWLLWLYYHFSVRKAVILFQTIIPRNYMHGLKG